MTSAFVATDTVLDKILARKVEELDEQRRSTTLAEIRRRAEAPPHQPLDMIEALRGDCVALIAEIKCASPSKDC